MSLLSYYRDYPTVRDYHKLEGHARRYLDVFEITAPTGDEMVQTTIPGQIGFTPWLVEAPLNSVEVLEAMLKPSQPFTIHKARHVPLRRRKDSPLNKTNDPHAIAYLRKRNKGRRRLLEEFMQGQGQLIQDREISFICLPNEAVETLRNTFRSTYDTVQLYWMSIPWFVGDGHPIFVRHPKALVLHFQPSPEPPIQLLPYDMDVDPSYETVLNNTLEKLGILGCDFSRSLLEPGTVPIPETMKNWLLGIPGETAALPCFKKKPVEDVPVENRLGTLTLRERL